MRSDSNDKFSKNQATTQPQTVINSGPNSIKGTYSLHDPYNRKKQAQTPNRESVKYKKIERMQTMAYQNDISDYEKNQTVQFRTFYN